MRLHPEGPPNMTKGGSLVLVATCGALGIAGLAAAAEAYGDVGPIKWLYLLPVALAAIGSYKTHELFNVWEASSTSRGVNLDLREKAKRMQDSAGSWCAAAMIGVVLATLGIIDALRASS